MKKCKQIFVVLALTASLAGCGGGGSGTLTADQQQQILEIVQGLVETGGGFGMGLSALQAQTTEACASGSYTITQMSITYDNCDFVGDGSLVVDGTIDSSLNGNTVTISYDLDYIAEGEIFSMNGDMSMDGETGATTYDNFEVTTDGSSFGIDGSLTPNPDGTVDGDLTFSIDGASATCVFDGFDPSTATEDDYADACRF